MPSTAIHPVLPQTEPPQNQSNLPISQKKRKTVAAKSKKKQTAASEKRILSDDNELLIIDYWKDHYDLYGKSNKKVFASKAAEDLNREHFLSDNNDPTPVSSDQLERLLAFWMKKYKKVSKQFSDSGFGLDDGDPQSIREHAERKMKHFYTFHSFLACKANVNPPVLLQTKNRNRYGAATIDERYGSLALDTNSDRFRNEENMDDEEFVVDDVVVGELDAGGEAENQIEDIPSRIGSSNSRILQEGSRKRRSSPIAGLNSKAPPRKKTNSGALVVDDEDEDVTPAVTNRNIARGGSASGRRGSTGRNRGSNDAFGERKSSSSRLQIVDSIYASQKTQNEAQNESLVKTVAALENENVWRRREVEVLEQSLKWQEKEQDRLDREEERKQREEERSKRDERRRQLDMDSKLIIHRADQLRSQASMYKSLGYDEKALECLKEADVLLSDLGKIGDTTRDQHGSL